MSRHFSLVLLQLLYSIASPVPTSRPVLQSYKFRLKPKSSVPTSVYIHCARYCIGYEFHEAPHAQCVSMGISEKKNKEQVVEYDCDRADPATRETASIQLDQPLHVVCFYPLLPVIHGGKTEELCVKERKRNLQFRTQEEKNEEGWISKDAVILLGCPLVFIAQVSSHSNDLCFGSGNRRVTVNDDGSGNPPSSSARTCDLDAEENTLSDGFNQQFPSPGVDGENIGYPMPEGDNDVGILPPQFMMNPEESEQFGQDRILDPMNQNPNNDESSVPLQPQPHLNLVGFRGSVPLTLRERGSRPVYLRPHPSGEGTMMVARGGAGDECAKIWCDDEVRMVMSGPVNDSCYSFRLKFVDCGGNTTHSRSHRPRLNANFTCH